MSKEMYLIIDENDNAHVDRMQRVIQRLVQSDSTRAYQIDTSTEPPSLSPARIGNKNHIVAELVVKDLLVDDEVVSEAQVQIEVPQPEDDTG